MTIEGGPALPIVLSQDPPDGSLAALPVYWTTDRPNQGGPALPVKVCLDSDLVQNGGQYRLEGRPQALPVFVAPAGTPILGQRPIPVYPINRNIWYLERMKNLFGSALIGYWPMNEASGAVALDYSGRGFHGAYTGVTLGQPGIGDGLTCPLFNGANGKNNVYSTGFDAGFNKQAGSFLIWAKLKSSFLSDGFTHTIISVGEPTQANIAIIRKLSTGDDYGISYIAAGVPRTVNADQPSLDWVHWALTWDLVADQMKAYMNGAQQGVTQTGLGTWIVALNSGWCVIGDINTSGAQPWADNSQHAAILNRAATPAEVAAAAKTL